MILTAQIVRYADGQLLLAPDVSIDSILDQKHIGSVELRLNDGRNISNDQRRKIFAIIRDISLWSGHEPEELRQLMTWDFCYKKDFDWFSLRDVDMTTAREFLTYLIEFCFMWGVPTRDSLLNQTDDIGRYLYLCLAHRKCAICNAHAEVHHVNRIGMGRDREKVVHIGLKAIALCHEHHGQAHLGEKKLFEENYIYGIKLDAHLCERLRLNTKNRKDGRR